jgi:biopolymer transport protein ExbD
MSMHRRHHDPHAHVIHPPGARLLHAVPLRYVRDRDRGRRGVTASINMASFLDLLIVTVLFLLSSFSASAECPTREVRVPGASSGQEMLDAPMVAVSGGVILLDGVLAGSAREIAESGRTAKMDELSRMLAQKRALWIAVQPKKPFPGECVLQIDRDVPAVVVKSVFQAVVTAGYPRVSFMVRKLPAMAP